MGVDMHACVRQLKLRTSEDCRGGPAAGRRVVHRPEILGVVVHLLHKRQQRSVKRFRGGLVAKAHGWLYHSTQGSRVIKKKKKKQSVLEGDFSCSNARYGGRFAE